MGTKTNQNMAKFHKLINAIRDYPVTADEVMQIARKLDAPEEVVAFYCEFPPDAVFSDRGDLITRTEEVEIFEESMPDQPEEEIRSLQL